MNKTGRYAFLAAAAIAALALLSHAFPSAGGTPSRNAVRQIHEANGPAFEWAAFMGGSGLDKAIAITSGSEGEAYILGTSSQSWGKPVTPFSPLCRNFLAKLDGSGCLVWHTFLEGSYTNFSGVQFRDGVGVLVHGSRSITLIDPDNGQVLSFREIKFTTPWPAEIKKLGIDDRSDLYLLVTSFFEFGTCEIIKLSAREADFGREYWRRSLIGLALDLAVDERGRFYVYYGEGRISAHAQTTGLSGGSGWLGDDFIMSARMISNPEGRLILTCRGIILSLADTVTAYRQWREDLGWGPGGSDLARFDRNDGRLYIMHSINAPTRIKRTEENETGLPSTFYYLTCPLPMLDFSLGADGSLYLAGTRDSEYKDALNSPIGNDDVIVFKYNRKIPG